MTSPTHPHPDPLPSREREDVLPPPIKGEESPPESERRPYRYGRRSFPSFPGRVLLAHTLAAAADCQRAAEGKHGDAEE